MKFDTIGIIACISILVVSEARRTASTIEPDKSAIEKAQATSKSDHSTSAVSGKAFDRFIVIWLENTNEKDAADDPDLHWLSKYGITLTNYWALAHPSEPNYIASVGGDTFGLEEDVFIRLPSNVTTIVDLLEDKNISWGEYEQGLPYTGFQGFEFLNEETGDNNYVRKHNPLISYDSITSNPSRLARIKNFTEFNKDLHNNALPQWMFITPNMTNDGHDSSIMTAGKWCKSFLGPLMDNKYFMDNTAVLLTFDENENYNKQNKVWALLIGGAIDKSLHNTSDSTYYTHYSEISSIEDNWDLYSLGRSDLNSDGNANVFQFVANKTGYMNKEVDTSNQYFNKAIDGYWNDIQRMLPVVNCSAKGVTGKGVLPKIKDKWCTKSNPSSQSSTSSNAVVVNQASIITSILGLFLSLVI